MLGRLAAQQAQHDLALAPHAPALTWSQRSSLGWVAGHADLACGQRGRAAPALAAHTPINRNSVFDLVHAGPHLVYLRSDKSPSNETGSSSPTGSAVAAAPI